MPKRVTKLSILILWITNRNALELIQWLDKQATDNVEILYLMDNKRHTVSDKRNYLVNMAKWEYITFVDDDDKVSDNYVSEILQAIENNNVDVINFKASISINWWDREDVIFSKDNENKHIDWIYYRQPNHLMVFKKELSKQVPFDNVNCEDTIFAKKINDKINTEYIIDKTLYYYNFYSDKSECQWVEHFNVNR